VSFAAAVRLHLGRETYKLSFTIPVAPAPGRAYYQVELRYACNIFHKMGWPIIVMSPPIRFEIVPGIVIEPDP
jgi:hypothetical protein